MAAYRVLYIILGMAVINEPLELSVWNFISK